MNCAGLSNEAIGKRIEALRAEHKETQVQLQKAIGLSKREYLAKYENGTNAISCYHLGLIAQHYGVSTDYLLGLTDIPAPDTSLRGAIENTGLTEKAISNLKNLQSVEGASNEYNATILNSFLESGHFITLIRAMQNLLYIKLIADSKFQIDKNNTPTELFNEELESNFAISRAELAKLSFIKSAEEIVNGIMQEIDKEQSSILSGDVQLEESKYKGSFIRELLRTIGGNTNG